MIKNIIYHCFPVNNWEYIVDDIKPFVKIFNGKRIVTISNYGDVEGAKKIFQQYRFTDILIVPHTEYCEYEGLLPAFYELKKSSGITFRTHTKGVTQSRDLWQNDRWRRTMLWECLSNINNIETKMQYGLVAGTFYLSPYSNHFDHEESFNWPLWFYAGSTYWFNNNKLYDILSKKIFNPHTHLVEFLPCFFCPGESAIKLGSNWFQYDDPNSWGKIENITQNMIGNICL